MRGKVGGMIEAPLGWLFIGPYLVPKPQRRLVSQIQAKVARYYQTTRLDMISARRTNDVIRPRMVAMYLARKLTPSSLPEIGRRFGGRDHSTVRSAILRIDGMREADPKLDNDIRTLTRELEG